MYQQWPTMATCNTSSKTPQESRRTHIVASHLQPCRTLLQASDVCFIDVLEDRTRHHVFACMYHEDFNHLMMVGILTFHEPCLCSLNCQQFNELSTFLKIEFEVVFMYVQYHLIPLGFGKLTD